MKLNEIAASMHEQSKRIAQVVLSQVAGPEMTEDRKPKLDEIYRGCGKPLPMDQFKGLIDRFVSSNLLICKDGHYEMDQLGWLLLIAVGSEVQIVKVPQGAGDDDIEAMIKAMSKRSDHMLH